MPYTVLLDMDGPLTAFDQAFFDRCADYGWTMDIANVSEQRHRFATDHVIDRKHRAAARRMVDSPGWFRSLEPTEGAIDGLRELAEHADVWIVTKPLESNPTNRDEKAEWVERYLGPEWLRRLIISPHKGLVRGDVLLDDAPHLDWFDTAEWRPVIFSSPWNGVGSKWAGLPRWTWGDDMSLLLDRQCPSVLPDFLGCNIRCVRHHHRGNGDHEGHTDVGQRVVW